MSASSFFSQVKVLTTVRDFRAYVFVIMLCAPAVALAVEKKPFSPADLMDLRTVTDPQVAPDGNWVAYVVSARDATEDKAISNLWMSSWNGKRTLQMTRSKKGASSPRWSPDGRALAFVEARGGDDAKSQVWLLDRDGGEARQLTKLPGGVDEFEWSPDGKRLAVIAADVDPDEPAEDAKPEAKKLLPKPIVIDRFQFKDDKVGYLRRLRSHLYVFDLASEKATVLTPGDFDEETPVWSPDSRRIVFVSKREGDPDRNENTDLYLVNAEAGAIARPLTSYPGADSDPVWSPDGKQIAFLRGGPMQYREYDPAQIAVLSVDGGEARVLGATLDRAASNLTWSADGRSLLFLLEDDRSRQLASITLKDEKISRLSESKAVAQGFSLNGKHTALLLTRPTQPGEVFAFEQGRTRQLSTQNDTLVERLQLAPVEGYEATASDGNIVHGLLLKPVNYEAGKKYPMVAFIHGGPVGQDGFGFHIIAQLLAGSGYAVVQPNYRGSSGRGRDYSRSIWGAWGHKEVLDVLASVDHVVASGLADSNRLGIAGWSYGGMMTNYTIASDTRFKAAISGAGISNMLAGYGTDQYTRQYELEFGTPWKNMDKFLAASEPFYHADRIKTPTLFLCGEKDFNVPLINSEQMYQALSSLGIETQLVIYPGQHHGLTKPSHEVDRLQRFRDWFGKRL